jgi:hypothetical protein
VRLQPVLVVLRNSSDRYTADNMKGSGSKYCGSVTASEQVARPLDALHALQAALEGEARYVACIAGRTGRSCNGKLGRVRVLVVRRCLRLPAVGFA